MIFVWHCFLSTRIALGTDTSFIEDITRCWKVSIKIWEKGSRKSSDKHVCCNMARIICSHSNRKLTLGSVWYMEALGTLGAPSQVYFTGKYKHCNVQGCSWGEASSCESVHWARHISSDGIWHLDKRGLGVPPPHYLTPLTAHSICNLQCFTKHTALQRREHDCTRKCIWCGGEWRR